MTRDPWYELSQISKKLDRIADEIATFRREMFPPPEEKVTLRDQDGGEVSVPVSSIPPAHREARPPQEPTESPSVAMSGRVSNQAPDNPGADAPRPLPPSEDVAFGGPPVFEITRACPRCGLPHTELEGWINRCK